jgi:hypothetical protein
MNQEKGDAINWKKEYTIVLILNLVYLLIFSFIMSSYN